MIADTFSSAELLCRVPPDEALAYGAATEAGILQGRTAYVHNPPTCMIPSLSLPIYCKVSF